MIWHGMTMKPRIMSAGNYSVEVSQINPQPYPLESMKRNLTCKIPSAMHALKPRGHGHPKEAFNHFPKAWDRLEKPNASIILFTITITLTITIAMTVAFTIAITITITSTIATTILEQLAYDWQAPLALPECFDEKLVRSARTYKVRWEKIGFPFFSMLLALIIHSVVAFLLISLFGSISILAVSIHFADVYVVMFFLSQVASKVEAWATS